MFILEIPGDPVPQKQTQFVRKTGIAYNPSKSSQDRIRWCVRPYAPSEPLACPVSLKISFYFEPPKSTSGIRRRQMLNGVIHHTKKPDADNCAYLITNALKGIFYVDDSQIIDLSISKRFGSPSKTIVQIVPIEEIAPTRGIECA
jgi:Holliday junction resolvase RusA-like endonuclease